MTRLDRAILAGGAVVDVLLLITVAYVAWRVL